MVIDLYRPRSCPRYQISHSPCGQWTSSNHCTSSSSPVWTVDILQSLHVLVIPRVEVDILQPLHVLVISRVDSGHPPIIARPRHLPCGQWTSSNHCTSSSSPVWTVDILQSLHVLVISRVDSGHPPTIAHPRHLPCGQWTSSNHCTSSSSPVQFAGLRLSTPSRYQSKQAAFVEVGSSH